MKKRKLLFLILFFILLLGISFYFDHEIVKKASLMRNSSFDNFLVKITFLCSESALFIFLTILFLWIKSKRKWILHLWVTFGVSTIISFLLKITIQRQRPFQLGICYTLPILEKANHFIWNYSFPSFHAMLAFCAIPFLSKEFPKFKYFWIAFASLIAFSRVYFGVHFLSDVIAGGLIGYLIGWFVLKTEKENKSCEGVYRRIFD